MSHVEVYDAPRTVTPARAAAFDMKVDFFDALSANDIDRAATVFAEDGTLLFPGLRPVKGRPLVKRMLGIIRRRYMNISWELASPMLNVDGWLITAWTVTGTFQHTGASYNNEVLSLIRLDADGRIAMLSDYFKDTVSFHPAAAITAPARSTLQAVA